MIEDERKGTVVGDVGEKMLVSKRDRLRKRRRIGGREGQEEEESISRGERVARTETSQLLKGLKEGYGR